MPRLPISLALCLIALSSGPALAMSAKPQAEPPQAATAKPIAEEHWQGALEVGGTRLMLVFHLAQQPDGSWTGTLDVPAQGAKGIPMENVVRDGQALRFTINAIHAQYEGTLAGRQATGTWSQGGKGLPLALERTDAPVAGPARPQMPKPPFPYASEDVSYTNPVDGTKLAGTLTLPAGQGPFPAVVLISGSGAQDRDETILGHKPFAVIADDLTRRGVAVLRVDDRGVGGSGGNPETSSSKDFATDVEAGMAFLQAHRAIDARRIGLIGHSEGGLIAPLVAAQRPKDVAFVVLLAGPGERGDRLIESQIRVLGQKAGKSPAEIEADIKRQREVYAIVRTEKDPKKAAQRLRAVLAPTVKGNPEAEAQLDPMIRAVLSPWYRTFIDLDPQPLLAQLKVPVLALNGGLDVQVPAEANLAAIAKTVRANGNRDVTTKLLPGLNHLFQPAKTGLPNEYATIETTFDPAALKLMGDWIVAHTKR